MHHTAQHPLHHPIHRRFPRAGIDTISDADAAFALLATAVHRPLRHETIVLVLDDSRRGLTIVVVTDTESPDAVISVVECLAGCLPESAASMVIASVRPCAPDIASHPDPGERGRDVDRWLEMSELASITGVEVLEWFVIDHAVRCPRDDLGEAPRW